VVYCSVCDAELSRTNVVIDMLGHDHSTEWTVDLAPTCTQAGSKSHHCSRCDDKADVTEIAPNGHDYECTVSGDKVIYICRDCDDSYEEILADLAAHLSCTDFYTAWNLNFTTTVLADKPIGEGKTFTLVYDTQYVTLVNIVVADGVRVNTDTNGVITVTVDQTVLEGESLFDVTFKTSNYLTSGSYTFLAAGKNQLVISNFNDLVIYEMGDVNMDGKVSAKDVMLIKQYSVKMIELNEVQKAYANTYVDYDANGGDNISARDALLIQQSIVKMDVTLGDRVEVTFVYVSDDDQQTEIKRSVHKGEDLVLVPEEPEGMAWSESLTTYVEAEFTAITKQKHYYLIRKGKNE
jgi:hypothetical protein